MRNVKRPRALVRIHSLYNLPDTPAGWRRARELLRQHNAPPPGKRFPRRSSLRFPGPPSPRRRRR